MQNIINIKDLKIEAIHGVYDEEKKNPQPFIFNAKIYLNFLKAAKSDDLKDTLSYCDIMQDINDFAKNNSFNLIETLSYRCALMLILKYRQIENLLKYTSTKDFEKESNDKIIEKSPLLEDMKLLQNRLYKSRLSKNKNIVF